MGFTKLDEGILQSSVMAESGSVFKVWIALLASCGQDGIAKVSSVFLSSACHLPQKTVDHAIENLSSPDPRSRSLNDEGRRIQRVDGGYRVINYEKYRAFSPNEGNPNSPGALRVRRWREKQKSVTCPPDVTPGNVTSVTSASASASASVFLNLQGWVWEGITDEDKSGWAKAYPACDIDRELLSMIEWAKANQAKAVKKNYRRFIVNWLSKSQERGGGMKSNPPARQPPGRDIYSGFRAFAQRNQINTEEKP